MPGLNTGLLQRTSSAHSPSLQIPFSLQVTTNQPRPRPKAFPRARIHFSLLAYHSGPPIRAHSLPSPIKPATASQTPRPASIHSAYPLNLAPFAAPQQIEFLRRAVFSRCTPAGPQDSNLTALLGFLPRVGSIYVWVWHGTSLERVSCVEPVVRARWKWRTRLELQCHACVGSLSRA
jgi:hypothetical protein